LTPSTPLPSGFDFRLAGSADNPAILEFVEQHVMRADLTLRLDRGPDFFGLLDAHAPRHETWLLLERGALVGLGSVVIRPGYIEGAPEPVAYFGDLRVRRHRAVAGLWHALFRERASALSAQLGFRYAFCCIIRDNRLARAALVRPRGEDFRFRPLVGYSSVALFARKPLRRTIRDVEVRRATAADAETVRAFLDAHSRRRPFGVVFDRATWRHRLQSWPAFGIENFYLAFDATQRLVGCVAPWDVAALNRVVIESMPRPLNLLRTAYNALAPLLRKPKIRIGPGSALPDLMLTHVCVANGDTRVFAALLDAVYGDAAATGRYATLSLCVFDGEPLAAALDGYWHHRVPMDVCWLALGAAAKPLHMEAGEIPGFEMYLV
jgi:hypothetical protein